MEENILTSIKTQLAIMPEDESYDRELLIFINAAIARLTQLGVGPVQGFAVNEYTNWSEFVTDITQTSMIEVYVYLKVKSLFDAPTNSSLAKHMEQQINEYEYLLKVESEDDAYAQY